MADIKKTYTIPSALVAEMIEVFGQGYQEQVSNEDGEMVDNPQTKAQYASQQLDNTVIGAVRHRINQYRRTQALQAVDNDFGIIAE